MYIYIIFKNKSQKESQKSRNQGFFLLFLHDDRRIRIRIQENQKHTDPTDPDPPQWLEIRKIPVLGGRENSETVSRKPLPRASTIPKNTDK